jgi:O-Antigen ligase
MNFGLESYIAPLEYGGFIAVFLLTVFWRPILGIYFLIPLIPLQTIRYRMNEFPLGASVIGIMLLGVLLGSLRRGQSVLPKTPWTKLLCGYALLTFVSLMIGSFYLGRPFPLPGDPRFGVWQDYMTMPALLLATAAVSPTKLQMKSIIILMCLTTFALDHSYWGVVSGRDYSTYTEGLREGGGMGYAGSNGLAAFEAQIAMLMFVLAAFERKVLLRIGYYFLAGFSALCLTYSLSRGGYLAFVAGCLFVGLLKQRKLLLLLAVLVFSWTSIVPQAVQNRVSMSYDKRSGSLDHSAETRLTLWDDAVEMFHSSPVLGTGFNSYAYMHREKRTDGVEGYYEDTHNYYLKTVVETGVLGLLAFLWLLFWTFRTGFSLYRHTKDPFFASLGLGLAAWVVTAATANFFGDRWTFLQVNGYMWVIGGLVSQAWLMERSAASKTVEERGMPGDSAIVLETTPGQA